MIGQGKWAQAGVPHAGWACDGVEDLGRAARETCEMCECTEIRYVHAMRHAEYGTLRCGCVCAGHMQGDLAAARAREAAARKRSVRLKRWLQRPWRVSTRGNPWLKLEGWHAVIFAVPAGWGCALTAPNGTEYRGDRTYGSEAEAKAAAIVGIASTAT